MSQVLEQSALRRAIKDIAFDRLSDARRILRIFSRINPTSPEALVLLAYACEQLGHHREAKRARSKAEDTAPNILPTFNQWFSATVREMVSEAHEQGDVGEAAVLTDLLRRLPAIPGHAAIPDKPSPSPELTLLLEITTALDEIPIAELSFLTEPNAAFRVHQFGGAPELTRLLARLNPATIRPIADFILKHITAGRGIKVYVEGTQLPGIQPSNILDLLDALLTGASRGA